MVEALENASVGGLKGCYHCICLRCCLKQPIVKNTKDRTITCTRQVTYKTLFDHLKTKARKPHLLIGDFLVKLKIPNLNYNHTSQYLTSIKNHNM